MRQRVRAQVGLLTASLLGILLAWGPVRAEDGEIEELRGRLERLEKQNEQLLKALEGKKQDPDPAGKADGQAGKEPAKEASEKTYVIGSDLNMRVYWNHGLEAMTNDEAFRVHVGGRTQIDHTWIGTSYRVMFGEGGIGQAEDGVNLRRVRLDAEASLYEQIDFFMQIDFLNTAAVRDHNDELQVFNTPAPTDVWVTILKLPVLGNVRVGHQKPPISFEHLTSSRFLDFLERSLPFDAFIENQDNGWSPGIQAFNGFLDERATWALGLFKNTRNVFGWNLGDGELEVVGRLTGLPVYEEEGRYLVHVGLGAYYRDTDNDQARYRARTQIRNGPALLHNVIAEARMLADAEALIVPELAMVVGPFTLQAEYYGNWAFNAVSPIQPKEDRVPRGTVFYQGFYVQALYFLTGEHRTYNRTLQFWERRRLAVFDRVTPNENFFLVEDEAGNRVFGKGAWQVGLRYSYLDLDEKGINGGATSSGAVIHDWTLGLNWFFNPNLKFQVNYDLAYRESSTGKSNGAIHALGTRLAFDF